MSQGRCAGCGETGPVRKVTNHIMTCPEFARLFRERPADAIGPVPEYERWLAEDRAAERQQAVSESIAAVDAQRAAMARRFARPPDILEE